MRRDRPDRRWRLLKAVGLLIVLLTVPAWSPSTYYIHLADVIGINMILALSLNLLFGFTGQLSFAHGAFYGLGAYTSVLVSSRYELPFLLAVAAALVVPAAIAVVVGVPFLRMRGNYLAIATLAVQLGIHSGFIHASGITGGSPGFFDIRPATLFGYAFASEYAYFYLIGVFLFLTYLFVHNLDRSRVGRSFRAIREQDLAAQMLGVDSAKYRVVAFGLSAAIAGLAGALYAHLVRFISPSNFELSLSVVVLTMVVVGGLGHNAGALIGAVIVTLLPEFLTGMEDQQFLVYGLFIIVLMILAPGGVVQLLGSRKRRGPGKPEEVEPNHAA